MILENYEDYKKIVDMWDNSNKNVKLFWDFLRKGHESPDYYLKLFLFEKEDSNVKEYVEYIENTNSWNKYEYMFHGMIQQINIGFKRIKFYKECIEKEKQKKEISKIPTTQNKIDILPLPPPPPPKSNNPFARGRIRISPKLYKEKTHVNKTRKKLRFDLPSKSNSVSSISNHSFKSKNKSSRKKLRSKLRSKSKSKSTSISSMYSQSS
jgi:hypothetical protein